jgi:arylsulfatase A-like enzyme
VSRPHVLLICVDHWPGPLLGAAGHERILTPSLDQLAVNGTLFTQAYTATPTCIPARRALMTGTTARTHGDRVFDEHLPMDPALPTMPQVFRDNGYQAYAVGKLHVYPQRDRIGFDEVILCEEGRHHLGGDDDDFERFLRREGFPGQELTHAMGNNAYTTRPWHLPEHCHPTNWTVRQMCETIQRRDPTRPSFITPHPPVVPPQPYYDLYERLGVDAPVVAGWAQDPASLPGALRLHHGKVPAMGDTAIRLARQAFYAQCTYIDHQLRLLIGCLREEGLLDDTIVMFTSDHGDMLGHHGLWAKPPMFEWSAKIPMILMPTAAYDRSGHDQRDDRLAELRDVMPTLLDLCGLPVPSSVEGLSLVSNQRREHLYCEHFEDERAMRMVRSGPHKLIWYPVGNRLQLFDVDGDPMEQRDLAEDAAHEAVRARLTELLVSELYGQDEKWVRGGQLVGEADRELPPAPNRGLSGQRGWR